MVLSTRNYDAPARRADLEAWVRTYGVNYTCVVDSVEEPRLTSQRRYGGRDTALVVDLATMRVVAKEQGLGATASSATRALPELFRRLRGP